jgi:hypothetical protein
MGQLNRKLALILLTTHALLMASYLATSAMAQSIVEVPDWSAKLTND